MDTFITSRATQHEVNSLDKRLKMLLSRKRLNHNPKGIEGFSTLGVPNTDDLTSSVENQQASAASGTTDYTATYEKYVKTQKEKWTNAFAFLTKADLKKPSEWHNVIKGIVYAFPISVEIIVDEFADSMPVLPEGGTVSQYYKNREDDKRFLKESVYEFGYVLVSMYISHMLYTRIYTGNDLEHVSEAWNFSFIPGLKHLIDTELFVYYQLAPEILETFVTVIVPIIIQFFVYSNYFSLRIFALFIVSYFLTYYFFDIIVKMFMQSVEAIFGMLSFKFQTGSTPFTYAMIMGGLAKYLINPVNLFYVFSSTSMTFGIYLAFFFLHLITTIVFAPFCQLIFVFYVMYVMFGGPSDIVNLVLSWFVKTVQSFFKDVEVDVAQSNMSNPEEIFGGFDLLSYKYGYTYFFFFIMLLFFFFKTIQSAVDLKTTSIRTAVSTSNAYITATMLVIYLAKYFTNKPVKRQEFSIGKKPVAKEEPGVASDSEDSDSDVESEFGSDVDSVVESDVGAKSVVKKLIGENSLLQNVLGNTNPDTSSQLPKSSKSKPVESTNTTTPPSQKSAVPSLPPVSSSVTSAKSSPRIDYIFDKTYGEIPKETLELWNKEKSKEPKIPSNVPVLIPAARYFEARIKPESKVSNEFPSAETTSTLPPNPPPPALPTEMPPRPPSPTSTTSQTSSQPASPSQTAVTSTSTSTSEEVPPQTSAQRSDSDSDSNSDIDPDDKVLGINENNEPKPSSPQQPQDEIIEICEKCDGIHRTEDCPYYKEKKEKIPPPSEEDDKWALQYFSDLETKEGEWGNHSTLTEFVKLHEGVMVIVHTEKPNGRWTTSHHKDDTKKSVIKKVIHVKHVKLEDGINKKCVNDECNHYILLQPKSNFDINQIQDVNYKFNKSDFNEIETVANGSCMFDAVTEGLKDPKKYENYSNAKNNERKTAFMETAKNIAIALRKMYVEGDNDTKTTIIYSMKRQPN